MAFDSTGGMHDACRRGLRHVLLACADTKLLLGFHYGEWTFGTPELEAAVANCSLSQSELGHVRLIHGLLKKHYDDDPDALIDTRGADAFANVSYLDKPLAGWPAVVAMTAIVDLAVTRMIHSLRASTFKPLGMSVDKMLDEERYHIHHGRGWFRTLAARDGPRREALETQVALALEAAAEWFGPNDDEDRALVDHGIKAMSNRDLFDALIEDVREMTTPVEMTVHKPMPTFGDWTASTRRVGGPGAGGPDAEILYHLRGSKNEIFKLG